jgi:tetratricopeptide (TPR) repeat protein
LLRDLKEVSDRDPNPALRSVTGYDLDHWIAEWQGELLGESEPAAEAAPDPGAGAPAPPAHTAELSQRDLAKLIRLGELFYDAEHFRLSAGSFQETLKYIPEHGKLHYDAAQSWLGMSDQKAAELALGELDALDSAHAGWFALHGRFKHENGEREAAERAFSFAYSIDPTREEVACEGYSRHNFQGDLASLPNQPERRALCEEARRVPTGAPTR